MILTTQQLIEKYNNLADPKGRISRDVYNGLLFPVCRGFYETNRNTDGVKLSQFIYGPSYLSFDYVLAHYSIIPEAVYKTYTCATLGKKKKKEYKNIFGNYIYRDIPKEVFSYGVRVVENGNYSYQIALPEKALCDKLYTISPVSSLKQFKTLLFEDLRIDENELNKMDKNLIYKIAPIYHKNNLDLLVKYLKEN